MDMIPYRMIALVLVVALLLTAVTPARAEALEVGTILLLVGVGVIVVIIVAYLVVASVKGRQMAASTDDANSLRMVPAAALAGSVAPMRSRHFWMPLSASSTIGMHGPCVMNVQRLLKKGRGRWTA